MLRIGITGHSNLSASSISHVLRALESELSPFSRDGFVGVSCLARGADQIFAHAVLNLGGSLEVVLPASDYRDRKVKPHNVAEFDELIGKATTIHTMPFDESNRDAYMAASNHIINTSDRMMAVWDGKPAGGHGGTGDVVQAAREHGIPVTIVWPEDAERE